MLYKKSVILCAVLTIGSNVFSMDSLRGLAAKRILKEKDLQEELEKKDVGGCNFVSRDVREQVGFTYLKEHLASSWDCFPEKLSLLTASEQCRTRGIVFLGSSSTAVSVDSSGILRWWNTERMAWDEDDTPLPLRVVDTKQRDIRALTISSDGQYLACAGGSLVTLWNADGKHIVSLKHPEACSVSYNSDATRIAIGTTQGGVSVWDLSTEEYCFHAVHSNLPENLSALKRVHTVGFSSDGTTVYSVGCIQDGCIKTSIKSWDTSGNCTDTLVLKSRAILGKIVFLEDNRALSTFTDGTIIISDLSEQTSRSVSLSIKAIQSSVFSSDGRFLLTGSRDKKVHIWEQKNGGFELIHEFDGGQILNHLAFRGDGYAFLSGDCFGSLDRWSISQSIRTKTLKEAQEALKEAQEALQAKKRKIDPDLDREKENSPIPLNELLVRLNGRLGGRN